MVELWLIVTLIIPYVETLIFTYQVIPGKFIHLYYMHVCGWVSSGFLPCRIPPKGFLPWDSSHQDSSHTGFLPRDSSPMGFLPNGIPPPWDSSQTGFLLQDSSHRIPPTWDSSHRIPPTRDSSHRIPPTWDSSHTGFLPHRIPPTRNSSHTEFLPLNTV